MKVAVLGPSPEALEMALALDQLGAGVVLFWADHYQQQWLNEAYGLTWSEMTSETGRQWLVTQGDNRWQDTVWLKQTPNVNDFQRLYQAPLISGLSERQKVVASEVLRVTKRFLAAGQQIPHQSRFADLFRITYAVDPTPSLVQRKQEQPDLYARMTEEFMASLKGMLEMFEDVDVVIDGSTSQHSAPMGPGGLAVGEGRLLNEFAHGHYPVNPIELIKANTQEITLVGDGAEAARLLVALAPWLWGKDGRRIFLSTSEATPFAQFMAESDSPMVTRLKDFLAEEAAYEQARMEKYHVDHTAWMELDDFIRAKKPAPQYPIPRLVLFAGHRVTATDQLVDKQRLFLTLEKIPWITPTVQIENGEQELKTIGCEQVFYATGNWRRWNLFHGLDVQAAADSKNAALGVGHREPGFFTLTHSGVLTKTYFQKTLQSVEDVLAELGKLFSRAN